MWLCIVTNFPITKPTRYTNFPNLFWHETLHVSGSSSAYHQEFIHCTLGTGICYTGLKTAFEQDQDGTAVPSWSCSKAVIRPVWHTLVPSVQWINSWWWAEKLPETCRVSCQNKFGKLVNIVGFVIGKENMYWLKLILCYMFRHVQVHKTRMSGCIQNIIKSWDINFCHICSVRKLYCSVISRALELL